ncbi:MAG: phosphoesterase [Candidatus Bathyarchaeia archaeon]
MRIAYAADVHGNEKTWRKFLNIPKYVKNIDVMMMGGDLTGKMLVPIFKQKDGTWKCSFNVEYHIKKEEELNDLINIIRFSGGYPYVTTKEEWESLEPSDKDRIMETQMKDTLDRWIRMIREVVPKEILMIINPGNDDSEVVDEVLRKSEEVIYPLDKVVKLDQYHELISCEYVNPSPWKTPRELPEDELERFLTKKLNDVSVDMDHLICNFHAPPYNSGLDIAPELDENLRPKTGSRGLSMIPVGSKAVRAFIEKHQPKLGLHGHIHESSGSRYIGKTLCVNPGSGYLEGMLRLYVIDVEKDKIRDYWRMSV